MCSSAKWFRSDDVFFKTDTRLKACDNICPRGNWRQLHLRGAKLQQQHLYAVVLLDSALRHAPEQQWTLQPSTDSFDVLRRTASANKADTCSQSSATSNGAKVAPDSLPPLNEQQHLHRRQLQGHDHGRMSRRQARVIGNSERMRSRRTDKRSSKNTPW